MHAGWLEPLVDTGRGRCEQGGDGEVRVHVRAGHSPLGAHRPRVFTEDATGHRPVVVPPGGPVAGELLGVRAPIGIDRRRVERHESRCVLQDSGDGPTQ